MTTAMYLEHYLDSMPRNLSHCQRQSQLELGSSLAPREVSQPQGLFLAPQTPPLYRNSTFVQKRQPRARYVVSFPTLARMKPMNGGEVSSNAYLANSIAATCRPRQIPRNGFWVLRHQEQAWIMPSIPRLPNPPGTRTPLQNCDIVDNEHAIDSSTHRIRHNSVTSSDITYLELKSEACSNGRVLQSFGHRSIRVLQLSVLAHQGNVHLAMEAVVPKHKQTPLNIKWETKTGVHTSGSLSSLLTDCLATLSTHSCTASVM
ncbi:hypothetical protein B566_EDAN008245 [Ephemera danica]|nr:hypothetical protein B566_EDAN008245 [Ephemera danica]